MFAVYFVSIVTVGTTATDWVNDGVFGDGYHLFGIGTAQYEEAITDYAKENVWTTDFVNTVDKAAEAGVVGADEIQAAIMVHLMRRMLRIQMLLRSQDMTYLKCMMRLLVRM